MKVIPTADLRSISLMTTESHDSMLDAHLSVRFLTDTAVR